MSLSTVRFGRRRLTRSVAAVAAVTALALGAAACSSSANDGSSGTASGGGEDASPGVTPDSVKVGFIIVDLGTLQQQLGFKQANYGGKEGQTKQIQASVDYVNANGGLNGRKIEPIIRVYDGTQDSPANAEAFCNALTQDDQVFAVVMDGQFQNNARPCYASRKTIMVDETLVAQDQAEFDKYAPYLWSPTHPEYGSFLRTQLAAMQQANFFAGSAGTAIIAVDNEVARRQVSSVVQPFLTQAGVTKSQVFYVDSSNAGTLGDGSSKALNGIANAGLDRTIVVGGARILPVLLSTSEAQTTKSKFAISSYDSPLFLQDNPESEVSATFNDMVGFGYLPAGDIRDDPSLPFPDPSRPNEGLCKQIIDNAGATPPEGVRANYKAGLQFCDGTLFLKAVLDKAPKDLTANRFRDAAWQVGTGFSSALTFGGALQQGKYAPTSVGRVLAYDAQTCQNPTTGKPGCFLYRGGNVPFSN